jgi:hypothetical protein
MFRLYLIKKTYRSLLQEFANDIRIEEKMVHKNKEHLRFLYYFIHYKTFKTFFHFKLYLNFILFKSISGEK